MISVIRKLLLTVLLVCMSLALQAHERTDTLDAAIKTDIRRTANQITAIETDVAGIRGMLSPLGEGDPIKWVQSLPGVVSGADGSSSFFVRGGNMGNNLITLDGVPVYGYSHLLGLTTIIPQDIIGGVSLIKGGFTESGGNFTSSHLQITTRDPETEGFGMSAALNNFFAGMSVELPVREDVSMMFSGRISPLSLEYKALRGILPSMLSGFDDFSTGIGDLYGKVSWRIDDRRRLDFSALGSMDSYSFMTPGGDYEKMGWDNVIGMAKYHEVTAGARTDVAASVSRYGSRQIQGKDFRGEWQVLSLKSDLLEASVSADRSHEYDCGLRLGYGLKGRYALFRPGQVASVDNATHALFFTASGQVAYALPCGLSFEGGVRAHYWQNLTSGDGRVDPDVSLSAGWTPSKYFSLEATLDRMLQYYHTLEGLPVGWSLDMIVPSGKTAVPESSHQGSLVASSQIGRHRFSVGGYQRKMDNLVYYRYAQTLFNGSFAGWEDNVDIGKGASYGGEILYEYNGDRLYSRLSYTLSKTIRFGFPNICDGEDFHARFDRRHVLNAMAQWRGFSAAVTLQSGHWENGAPESFIMHLPDDSEWTGYHYEGINNYHMPAVFRLDLGYNFLFDTGKVSHVVNVGVCNATNHFNPFMLYYDAQTEGFKMIALLPILPNFSYRISF